MPREDRNSEIDHHCHDEPDHAHDQEAAPAGKILFRGVAPEAQAQECAGSRKESLRDRHARFGEDEWVWHVGPLTSFAPAMGPFAKRIISWEADWTSGQTGTRPLSELNPCACHGDALHGDHGSRRHLPGSWGWAEARHNVPLT